MWSIGQKGKNRGREGGKGGAVLKWTDRKGWILGAGHRDRGDLAPPKWPAGSAYSSLESTQSTPYGNCSPLYDIYSILTLSATGNNKQLVRILIKETSNEWNQYNTIDLAFFTQYTSGNQLPAYTIILFSVSNITSNQAICQSLSLSVSEYKKPVAILQKLVPCGTDVDSSSGFQAVVTLTLYRVIP